MHTMKSWMTQLRKEREGCMEQNPEQGEEEEEAVERGSVGRMRGTEMVHNKLSRVFSCSPLYFFHFFFGLTDLFVPIILLPVCLALLLLLVSCFLLSF